MAKKYITLQTEKTLLLLCYMNMILHQGKNS